MTDSEAFKIVKKKMDTHNKLIAKEIDFILKATKQCATDEKNRLNNFLKSVCKSYSKEKEKIYEAHDIDNSLRFNFFESISDKWYRENFHSDILYAILNPNTPQIGRKYFVEELVKFLAIDDFGCKDFEVIKEAYTGEISWKDNNGNQKEKEGYIDLLVKNEAQAIIIENKINYAPDMENQLVRYMRYVEEKLVIKKYWVVYLTLIDDPNKKPPLDSYDKDFEKYTNLLKDKKSGILKEVYAVDDKKSLTKDFLPACCERIKKESETKDINTEARNIASVYIDQYKIMLEHLGGYAYMKSANKKLIEEIYSSQENLNAAWDFFDFWNEHRNEAVEEMLKDKFKEKVPGKELYKEKRNGADVFFCDGEKYSVYWQSPFQVGFASFEGKEFKDTEQENLFKEIKKLPCRKEGSENKDSQWVYCDLNLDERNKDCFDAVLKALEILFEYMEKDNS